MWRPFPTDVMDTYLRLHLERKANVDITCGIADPVSVKNGD
jgi:hypothetical protein